LSRATVHLLDYTGTPYNDDGEPRYFAHNGRFLKVEPSVDGAPYLTMVDGYAVTGIYDADMARAYLRGAGHAYHDIGAVPGMTPLVRSLLT
jgi:hypothetical protein